MSEINEVICPICSHTYDENDLIFEESSGETMCTDCFDSRNFCCSHCNNYFPDSQDVGNNLCNRCYENHYFTCDNCGDINRLDDGGAEVEGSTYCESCLSNDATYCENCNEYFRNSHYDDSYYHECENGGGLREHGYKPEPKFFGDGQIFYGVELEVECQESISNSVENLSNHSEFIYIKKDGSLNRGFEVVSHPASLKFHQENHWEDILKRLRNSNCKSHDTTTCGLHVHMSREGMDAGHLKRFILFWYSQKNIVRALARRDFNGYCEDKDMGNTVIPSDAILRSRTRYEQINLQNENTVEVRRFRGTLNYTSFMACIELVDAVRKYTKTTSYKDMRNVEFTEQTFIGWVFKFRNAYPNLVQKLQQKIKFVAIDSE